MCVSLCVCDVCQTGNEIKAFFSKPSRRVQVSSPASVSQSVNLQWKSVHFFSTLISVIYVSPFPLIIAFFWSVVRRRRQPSQHLSLSFFLLLTLILPIIIAKWSRHLKKAVKVVCTLFVIFIIIVISREREREREKNASHFFPSKLVLPI